VIVLDAGPVIAVLESRDPHHADATRLLTDNVGEVLRIHSLNLAEVLVGGVKRRRGQEMLFDIESLGIGVATQHEGGPLRLAALRASTGLKLPDCCALDLAISHGAGLATFDETLMAAARAAGVRVLP